MTIYQQTGNNPSKDEQAFFDGYYNVQLPVSGAQFDAVQTFFLSRTNGEKEAARSLATSLLEITKNRGIDPMELIDQFKKYRSNDAFKNAIIALFNSGRSRTSRIGYSQPPAAAPLVVRNIRK